MKFLFFLLIPTIALTQTSKVTRVIDGDTFVIENGERVRVVGINAPEITDIFGPEAKQHLQTLIEGKTVELRPDHISNDRDRYSRLLRYVYLGGKDIDKQMLLDGYAVAYLKFHFEKPEEYKQAQLMAETNGLGMWHNPKSASKHEFSDSPKPSELSWRRLTPRIYFLLFLIFILLSIGLYSYFRK